MSDDVRNGLAEKLGDGLVWVFDRFGDITFSGAVIVVAIGAGLFLLWRLSLVFGPMKTCWRCGGDGATGGILGGKRECPSCHGSGLRPRAGSGGR